MNWQIAIDGPSSSGKSSVAKKIAEELDFFYFSSGKMYRAFAYVMQVNRLNIDLFLKIINQINWRFEKDAVYYNNADITTVITTQSVANIASKIAVDPNIRKIAVIKQQKLAENKNIVMDGRDIGTVVLKNAQLKFFLDAKVEIRAQRRLQDMGISLSNEKKLKELIQELKQRDQIDSSRTADPLKKAQDAIYLDTSELSFDAVVKQTLKEAKKVFKL
ncbi:(d)CMP kinase [Mycoplasmoides genitalium]|uniref:Cytidylate kinase n=1 Tax=Mycoplasma genitalium (strain ATCC 33530 / DSM 19775 / NCTC 10195 / G37) TaxID=243273 RepID=KCY_MYCGE|nr:(d)CMP kinase [Mycoplasmoides genitalium]P47572.1 RecName: Full=Cytidylate kinase; Short=CK; AltName: Full=Cytidine monophosphate kinase; Short=CMP kinase [Mycoplasmoides genitalium G37]ABY79252.1 cytidylate kinase [synthetic Mycoplasma genitalium JCVI-1.0]AAC71554.1 cytidylate kinase [Mycoplasmoides genitalium G37]AFQ03167.1 cytidylate kinase [Mycoplasmoides genitalium M2321]AFQ03653.1 cytidylate kinase [Mycoplasmoides genitalium M6282]AFQ04661.1 cytidylate kinase [Mycoplasmoides genitali